MGHRVIFWGTAKYGGMTCDLAFLTVLYTLKMPWFYYTAMPSDETQSDLRGRLTQQPWRPWRGPSPAEDFTKSNAQRVYTHLATSPLQYCDDRPPLCNTATTAVAEAIVAKYRRSRKGSHTLMHEELECRQQVSRGEQIPSYQLWQIR